MPTPSRYIRVRVDVIVDVNFPAAGLGEVLDSKALEDIAQRFQVAVEDHCAGDPVAIDCRIDARLAREHDVVRRLQEMAAAGGHD